MVEATNKAVDKSVAKTALETTTPAHAAGYVRWWLIGSSFIVWAMMNLMFRVNLAAVGPPLMEELHLDPFQYGLLFSSFGIGILVAAVPGGILCDLALKVSLIVCLAIGSVLTIMTGLCSDFSQLLLVRLGLGISQALLPMAAARMVMNWLLPTERATGTMFFGSGAQVGLVIGAPLAAWLTSLWGWRASFYMFGGFGLVIAILMWFTIDDNPEKSRWVSPEEFSRIKKAQEEFSAQTPARVGGTNRRAVYVNPWVWLMLVSHLGALAIFHTNVSWLPSYFAMATKLDLKGAGFLSAVPYLGGIIISLIVGYINDRVRWRSLGAIASLILAVLATWGAVGTSHLVLILVFLSLAQGLSLGAAGALWPLVMELLPQQYMGTAGGVVVNGGNIVAVLSPVLMGHFVKTTGSFTYGFLFVSGLVALGAVALAFVYKLERRVKGVSFSPVRSGGGPSSWLRRIAR